MNDKDLLAQLQMEVAGMRRLIENNSHLIKKSSEAQGVLDERLTKSEMDAAGTRRVIDRLIKKSSETQGVLAERLIELESVNGE